MCGLGDSNFFRILLNLFSSNFHAHHPCTYESIVREESSTVVQRYKGSTKEGFNDWEGRGYDDFVPEEVTKTVPSGDETT